MPPPEVIEGKKKYWHHGIRPNTLKILIGKGHPEFATKKQQDAQEFFLYLVSLIEVFFIITKVLYHFIQLELKIVSSVIVNVLKTQLSVSNLILRNVINVQPLEN